MTANGVSYIVVTPVRDEEMYFEHTLRSVVSQTTRPAEWVIVNDGSTDKTGEIATLGWENVVKLDEVFWK